MSKIKIDDKTQQSKGPMLTVDEMADIHIVGIKKIGPKRYVMVTGTVAHPIVDNVQEDIGLLASVLKRAMQRLIGAMP